MNALRRPLFALALALGVLGIAACAPPPSPPGPVDITVTPTGRAGTTGTFTTDIPGDSSHSFTVGTAVTLHAVPAGAHTITYNASTSWEPRVAGLFWEYYATKHGTVTFTASSSKPTVQLDTTLPADVTVTGTATPGVVVGLEGYVSGSWSVSVSAQVGADGRYVLPGVPAGAAQYTIGTLSTTLQPDGTPHVLSKESVTLAPGANVVALP